MTIWINLALCLSVIYTVFCRAAKSDGTTDPQVKRAFIILGIAAYLCGVLPFTHPQRFMLGVIALLVAIIYLQYVTGKFWREGPPPQFKKKIQ